MKWGIGILCVFVFFYWGVPVLFNAMVKHDYDTMYHRMREAKISAGSFVQREAKSYVTYEDEYAYDRN